MAREQGELHVLNASLRQNTTLPCSEASFQCTFSIHPCCFSFAPPMAYDSLAILSRTSMFLDSCSDQLLLFLGFPSLQPGKTFACKGLTLFPEGSGLDLCCCCS